MSQFIIDFVNTAGKDEISNYFAANNCTLVKEFNKFENVYVVTADTEPPKTELVESVIADDSAPITLLNKDFITYDVADTNNWWKLAVTNVQDFNATEITHVLPEKKVNVYLLDSGVKLDHPEFANADIEYIFTYDGTYDDVRGHGTALASVISGNTCSLTKMPIKVLKAFGSTPTMVSDLLNAFETVIEHNAASDEYGVLNLSWICPKNEYIENKIRIIIANGVPVVCSAGNSGQPINNVTPACMPEVVTVGAYNDSFEPCDFSNFTGVSNISLTENQVNYGELDVWAPGGNIRIATLDGSYGLASGTSMAAAIHSAATAYYVADFIADTPLLNQNFADPAGFYYTMTSNTNTHLFMSGLLSLTGQYANSANKATKFHSQMGTGNTTAFKEFLPKVMTIGKDKAFNRRMFFPRFVNHYEIIGTVPPWASIKDGWLYGIAQLDENLNQESHNFKVKFYTLDPDYSPEVEVTVTVLTEANIQDQIAGAILTANSQCTTLPSLCFACDNIGDTCLTDAGCSGNKESLACFCATGCP